MAMVAKGNKSAFEKLFNKYKRPIMNYIFQMIQDPVKAEEITQDVFLKVYKNAEQYDPNKKFTTWLWTIAKYTVIDFIRKKKEVMIEDALSSHDEDSEVSLVDQIPSNEDLIEDKIIRLSEKEIVQMCISKLPKIQKETIQLRVFSELPYTEIGEIIGKSEKAIKSIISRAKESLKVCVKQNSL